MNMEGVSRGKYADLYSPVRPFSPEERARVVENMQATYDTFVEKAAQGRNTTPERIDAIGQGRVWTGRQAKQIGLVDELGGLDRAVALAKQRAQDRAGIGSGAGDLPAEEVVLRLRARARSGPRTAAARSRRCSGFGIRRVVQALTAPLQVFRRGEPLALMPNIFVR